MKRSITGDMVNKIAIRWENDQDSKLDYSISEKVIPTNKTISEYVSALDKAVREFFLYGSDDNVVNILKDARKNQLVPKRYKAWDMNRFETNSISVRKASFSFANGKVTIKLFFNFGSVIITANKVIINGKIKMTANLIKLIEANQKSIEKINAIMK